MQITYLYLTLFTADPFSPLYLTPFYRPAKFFNQLSSL